LHTEGEGGLKRVIKEEQADGSAITREFDNAGRLVAQTDAAGRVTRLVNENGAGTTFTYDLLDRLAQETGFDGRTQRYHYSP
ncbi:RHS repeat protein, partial [Salmonella enterica]|uniref:RHS repeat protein n=1 Tax=Salmonella enterica TaxID=28901 RepID=UPI001BB08C59